MRALMAESSPFCLSIICSEIPRSTPLSTRETGRSGSCVLVSGDRRCKCRHVALRALVENLLTLDHVKYGFRDIGGVIADPLDVLGAEHQVDAKRDVARIFHHIGQELAEQRGADGV